MSSLANKISAVHRLGLGWAAWRGAYALRRRLGLFKQKFPTPRWEQVQLSNLLRNGVPSDAIGYKSFRDHSSAKFFFQPGCLPPRERLHEINGVDGVARTMAVADDYRAGRFHYYSRHVFDLGQPVDWRCNPFLNVRLYDNAHWCDWTTFSPEQGDIKDVWEPSRFACAYWLARAFAISGDESYPRAFWELFESWCEQNPPNRGPNWRCGQETAFRVMAWCFAMYTFWRSESTTPKRVTAMVQALALSAARIEPNIGFAISQKNNHAISEALGLFTVGTLFPELKQAAQWERHGRQILEREILRQVYTDGSYVQHSTNYHRLMLHDCVWALRLAELNGKPLKQSVLSRIGAAASFMHEMLDEPSGSAPNYGANDGAMVLPLSSCTYRDFRATVQLAMYAATSKRVLDDGPWNESLVWLFGVGALTAPRDARRSESRRFDSGGYYTIRAGRSWGMVRCHSYVDRPGQVDMLHLDLWYDGVNVLRDSGSYRYYEPREPGTEKYFKDIAAHSTVQVGQGGPLQLVSRFIWLPWPGGRCISHDTHSFVGEHDAYSRSPWHVTHRRSIRADRSGRWIVTDDLIGIGEQELTLRWQLADGEYVMNESNGEVSLRMPCGRVRITVEGPREMTFRVLRGVDSGGQWTGWVSEHYGERMPALVLVATCRAMLPARFVTTINLPMEQGPRA